VDSPPQGVIARLARELGKLPGVGTKSAERLTHHLLAAHAARPEALTSGYQRALFVCSLFVLAAALIASRAPNARTTAQPLVVPIEATADPAVV
jgi:hypothetical protein